VKRALLPRAAAGLIIALLAGALARVATAQETPRYGGELVFVVPAEPPSFDAHREESFALIHPAAPHYSTLLRVDPDDPSGTKLVGDLGETWSGAPNGRTWTFKIRRGVKFHDGWDRGKPYLDGYRALFVREASVQIAAIRGLRAMIQFRGFSPTDRDSLVQALGPRSRVQESPWECGNPLAVNHDRKPFDDRRVRRALTLALDRHQGAAALSKISIFKEVVGVQGVGTPFATPPAELTPSHFLNNQLDTVWLAPE
jgi:ABC-type transport system substrate-binding protein